MVLRIYWSGTADRNRVRPVVLASVGTCEVRQELCREVESWLLQITWSLGECLQDWGAWAQRYGEGEGSYKPQEV